MSVDSKQKTLALLSRTTLVSLVTATETTLYTVPAGKRAIVSHVFCHTPSASLVGVTVTFGSNAGTRTDWEGTARAIGLVTGVTLCQQILPMLAGDTVDVVTVIIEAAGTFGIKVTAGTATTATFDVFGYLLDS